jgi:hypothetical protein
MLPGISVPRTEEDLSVLIADRPGGWEFLLFAGALILELERLESRYEDYKLGYAPRSGTIIYESRVMEYIKIQANELKILMRHVTHLYNTEVAAVALAFGPSGSAGDPARLLHLAKRYISIYEEFLLWVERLRGASIPGKYTDLIAIFEQYADQPIEEIRRFVREYAEAAGRVPEAVASGTPVRLHVKLKFSVPDEVSAAFAAEIEKLKPKL